MTFLRPFIRKTITAAYYIKINRLGVSNYCYSTKPKNEEYDDEPIKYTTSPANKWKAQHSIQGHNETDRLWYEPIVMFGSIAAFLIYFCILREENDIDRHLTSSLYDRIEGLEEYQLKTVLKYNQDHNLSTKEILERLKQIEEETDN